MPPPPQVFTPGSVETKYTAVNKDGNSKVVIPPVGMWMICGGPWCSSMWLKDDVCGWGILGREADFSAVCVKAVWALLSQTFSQPPPPAALSLSTSPFETPYIGDFYRPP